MRNKLKHYLITEYSKIYNYNNKECAISCDDGWFRLILWTSRYMIDYLNSQNYHATLYPKLYLPVKEFAITRIYEEKGILKFDLVNQTDHIDSIFSYVSYISGFICTLSGSVRNVGYLKNNRHSKTLNLDYYNAADEFQHVDDDTLLEILKEIEIDEKVII